MKKVILIVLITMFASSVFAETPSYVRKEYKAGTPEAIVSKFLASVKSGDMGGIYSTSTESFIKVYRDSLAESCRENRISYAQTDTEFKYCLDRFEDFIVFEPTHHKKRISGVKTQIIRVPAQYIRTDNNDQTLGATFFLKNTQNGLKIYKSL